MVGSYVVLPLRGEFPGDAIILRFYIMHILLIPGILLALVAAHMAAARLPQNTQWPGPRPHRENVVGYPMLPVYMAKAGGFFFIVFGDHPAGWSVLDQRGVESTAPTTRPRSPAGSQPDWYMGWPDGLLRIIPAWGDASSASPCRGT